MNIVFDKFWIMPNYLTYKAFEKEKYLRVKLLGSQRRPNINSHLWVRDEGSFPSLDGTARAIPT